MRRSFVRFLSLLGTAAVLAACQEVSGPEAEVDESELTFVQFADDAPPLESDSVVFWAVRGETRVGEMRYATEDYVGKCLLFRVPAQALLRHPNGAPVRMGDTLYVNEEVVEIRPSTSKPDRGVVTTKVQVLNQEGVVCQEGLWVVLLTTRPA